MALGKQAKILSDKQVRAVLAELSTRRYPLRDRVMFMLSLKSGLRAKEIAGITWAMITDAEGEIGDVISLENRASKGKGGGPIFQCTRTLRQRSWLSTKSKTAGHIQIGRSSIASGTEVCRQARSLYGFTACTPGSGWSAAPRIAAGGRSSRVQRGGSARLAAACGMSKCWLDTQASAPLPDISSMTPMLSGR